MDVEIINNPISQSYEVLKNVDGSGEIGLTLEDGSNLFIDFTTSTQDI